MARPKSDIEPRILNAARERFLTEGVDGASLRNIARDAKTNIGMVYYYFSTKEELFLAVLEDVYAGLLADLEVALDAKQPFETRLEHLYERFGQLSPVEVKTIQLVLREGMVSSARFNSILARFKRGHLPLFAGLVMEGVQQGKFRRDVHPIVALLATVVLALIPQLMRRRVAQRAPFTGTPEREQLSAAMLDVLLHGIAATPAGRHHIVATPGERHDKDVSVPSTGHRNKKKRKEKS